MRWLPKRRGLFVIALISTAWAYSDIRSAEQLGRLPRRAPRCKGDGTTMQGVIGRWAEVCFPAGEESSEAGLRELIQEAADDTLDDNDEAAAVRWAEGYEFPVT